MVWPELTRIEPVFSPRLWGSHSLAPFYPEKINLTEPIGEAWLTGEECRISTGPYAGRELGEAWREMKTLWRGTRLRSTPNFPLLVKFIFPTEKLSIQVHPDDAYAQKHEKKAGGHGKTEMWHVVSAEPGARLLAGLKPGVTQEAFRKALNSEQLEGMFQSHEVHAGDTYFIPAGTPHTIGPNMILCEVQEYSDLTYRVYDYGRVDAQGRPRQLHIEKALAVMNFGKLAGGITSPIHLPFEGADRRLLVGCEHFAAERWECTEPTEICTIGETFQVIVFLRGSGEFSVRGGTSNYGRGEAWFIPAAIDSPRLTPREPTTFLLTYVPDLQSLRNELLDLGFDEAATSGVAFEQSKE